MNGYYDDWYLFGVIDGTQTSYGLYKMREQEYDGEDGDDPGVTISLISLDASILTACINVPTTENQYSLLQELDQVTGPGTAQHDTIITEYFADVHSDGSYLIAEEYVSFLVSLSLVGALNAPHNLIEIFDEIASIDSILNSGTLMDPEGVASLYQQREELQRIPNALEKINERAGTTVYNFSSNTVLIQNRHDLTIYEKQAILACFTADISFNMFAAEVEFHADFAIANPNIEPFYEMAIRADMAIGEEYNSGFADQYYDPNSSLVQAQIDAHGEW